MTRFTEAVACFSCKTPVHEATVWLQDAGRPVGMPQHLGCAGHIGRRRLAGRTWHLQGHDRTKPHVAPNSPTPVSANRLPRSSAGEFATRYIRKRCWDAAVSALGRALGATAAIFTAQNGRLDSAAASGALLDGIDSIVGGALDSEQASEARTDESEVLVRATSYRGEPNGAVVLARSQTALAVGRQ